MGADILSQFCICVDAAYGVHLDLKSHTVGCTYFGYGMLQCKSIKQKINTKSSTKVELVGVSDYLIYKIWICLFMGAQGYEIRQKIMFQDNQSAIKMEKIGKKLCTGKYRNIGICYFFSKRSIERKNVNSILQHITHDHICFY